MFEQSIVFHNAAAQNLNNVFYFKILAMCIFNAVKMQSGIGFIVDALFDYFAHLHSLYTVVELLTNYDTFWKAAVLKHPKFTDRMFSTSRRSLLGIVLAY